MKNDVSTLSRQVSPGLFCVTGGMFLLEAVGRKWRFKSRNPQKKVRQDLSRPRRSMSRREKTENHVVRLERLRAYQPGFHYSMEKWRWLKD